MKTINQYITEHMFSGKKVNVSSQKTSKYLEECKRLFGNNEGIIKTFTELIADIQRTAEFDIEDVPEEYRNDPEEAGDYVGYYEYLEDSTSEDDWHYNAYYDAFDHLRGSKSTKESNISMLFYLWLLENS